MRAGSKQTGVLALRIEGYVKPVVYTKVPRQAHHSKSVHTAAWTSADAHQLKELICSDPLTELSPADRKLLWDMRFLCKTKPEALTKVLLSADWTDPAVVEEAHELLGSWVPPTPKQALDLLDAHFADDKIREYAVERLKDMSDEELGNYTLQLVQVLKYEQYHDSPLACFLLTRAVRCPNVIGHIFFWHLKAEMHVPEIAERYGVLLEIYLENCGAHRRELMTQNQAISGFVAVARSIKAEFHPEVKGMSSDQKLALMRRGLEKLSFPPTFGLPLNPRWKCRGLRVEKCKYMDSKKLPLWLVFLNGVPAAISVHTSLLICPVALDALQPTWTAMTSTSSSRTVTICVRTC
jgi:phosphatidylinositol-4,5-bisphosphate 3-kinase